MAQEIILTLLDLPNLPDRKNLNQSISKKEKEISMDFLFFQEIGHTFVNQYKIYDSRFIVPCHNILVEKNMFWHKVERKIFFFICYYLNI